MKSIIIIVLALLVLILGLALLKDQLIKSAVEMVGSQVLGTPVHIKGMSVAIVNRAIKVQGLTVSNPLGFPQGNMLDIASIEVNYDLDQVVKGNIHLYKLQLQLNEMNLIKNKSGVLNVNRLHIAQNKEPGSKAPPFSIDVLTLDLGKVHYWDYGQEPPKHMTYDINIHDKTYHDIKSVEQFASLVMLESMTPTKIKTVLNFGFKTADKVFGTAKDAGSLIKDLFRH